MTHRNDAKTTSLPQGLVVFGINEQRYCVGIEQTRGIVKPEIVGATGSKSPAGSSTFMHGGSEYLCVDLISHFGEKNCTYDGDNRLILIEFEDQRYALLVERLVGVISSGLSDGKTVTFSPLTNDPDFSGLVGFDGDNLCLLDLGKIVAPPT